MEELKKIIRDVPDFPKKGILFKDITPLLENRDTFKKTLDILTEQYKNKHIDKILSIESRGFIFGSALAYNLNCGFVPIRKKGKLPSKTISVTYDLEYGTDTLEVHSDAVKPGEKVLIADDLLATGGTVGAVIELAEKLKADIVGCVFLIELEFLKGKEKLKGLPYFTLLKY